MKPPKNYKRNPSWLPKNCPVICGNYLGQNFRGWYNGCYYIQRIKNEYSKEYLVFNWNNFRQRFHHCRIDWPKAIKFWQWMFKAFCDQTKFSCGLH